METTEGRMETDQEQVEVEIKTGVCPYLCVPRGDGYCTYSCVAARLLIDLVELTEETTAMFVSIVNHT
jgi:hypothetical protein